MLGSVLGAQFKPTECEGVATPVPETGIDIGEFVASLMIVIVPENAAALGGVNITLSVAVCPGATVEPFSAEGELKPCDGMLTLLIVAEAFPEFVSDTAIVLLDPTTTFPKLNVEAFAVRRAVPATTVSIAGLLIRLPAELLTTAMKIEPSSERRVGGVTYVGSIASGMITPFFCHWYESGAVLAAATTNTPLFPTVTVSLAGFVVIDGGETGVGGGVGSGGGVGDGGAGDEGGDDGDVFAVPTTLEHPDRNNAGKASNVRRCKVFAQKGRGFGSRGQGCPIKKKKSS